MKHNNAIVMALLFVSLLVGGYETLRPNPRLAFEHAERPSALMARTILDSLTSTTATHNIPARLLTTFPQVVACIGMTHRPVASI